MKRYFWYRYMLIMGSKRSRPDKPKFTEKLQRKKNGELRDNRKNRELTDNDISNLKNTSQGYAVDVY